MFVHIIHADDHVLVRLEEDGAIVSEERRKELERSRLSLSIGALPVKMVIGRRGTENRFRHRPLHGLHCRRHDEDEQNQPCAKDSESLVRDSQLAESRTSFFEEKIFGIPEVGPCVRFLRTLGTKCKV